MSETKNQDLIDESGSCSSVLHKLNHYQVEIGCSKENASAEKPSTKIFILTVHCFDEIFEYISLKDLNSFGQTCKTMQQVAGQYFNKNYLSTKIGCNGIGIYAELTIGNPMTIGPPKIILNGFEPFINSIYLISIKHSFQYIQPYIDIIASIKKINLTFSYIKPREDILEYPTEVDFMRKVFQQIETLQIQYSVNDDFYASLLAYCDNLKQLYVQKSKLDLPYYDEFGQQKWLLQEYPTLEHFEYIPNGFLYLNELNSFLERNKKIHTFSTSVECLWDNRHAFMNSEAKLDVLEVKCFKEFGSDEPTLQSLCDLCNQLHEKGFFKRLHLYIQTVDEEFYAQAVLLNGLEKLCIKDFYGILPPLTGLKELAILDYFKNLDEPIDDAMEIIANDLVNLQRLYLNNANTIDDIMPFIRRSLKLNKIKVFFKEDFFFGQPIIPLSQLNREREKLFEARKVTIYVPEKSFTDTKWAIRNGDTNLTLIEMKRTDSYEWDQYYE